MSVFKELKDSKTHNTDIPRFWRFQISQFSFPQHTANFEDLLYKALDVVKDLISIIYFKTGVTDQIRSFMSRHSDALVYETLAQATKKCIFSW